MGFCSFMVLSDSIKFGTAAEAESEKMCTELLLQKYTFCFYFIMIVELEGLRYQTHVNHIQWPIENFLKEGAHKLKF